MSDVALHGWFDDWCEQELCWVCDAPRNGRLNTCCDEHEEQFTQSLEGRWPRNHE